MLTIHHLGKLQSERILWLCEELGVPYELKIHDRDPVTILSPPELKAMHPMGTAPVITDGDLLLAESGAIVDDIIAKHGGGRLTRGPADPDFAQYLYWYHFANASLQPGETHRWQHTKLLAECERPSDEHRMRDTACWRSRTAPGPLAAKLAAISGDG